MSLKRTIIASGLMILTMLCLTYIGHGENTQPYQSFSTFPKRIGDWVGEEQYFDQKIYEILGVDDSIFCDFFSPDNRQIELYVGFYQSQREGELIHSPKNCMPGAGWNFVKTKKASIGLGGFNNKTILINDILLQKGREKQIMFYWFQGRGRYIASEYAQKIYLVLDSITKRRTDEAFVRIIAPVIDDNEKETRRYLNNFTKLLIPVLEEYLPS